MSEKPSFLGLLNAIAVGEARGYEVLSSWCERTEDAELSRLLNAIAIREQEHAAAFTKRLCELGYQVRERPSEEFTANLALAKSSASDREKFEKILGYGAAQGTHDPLRNLFDDTTIDPATGALLGRFIAEERDSGRQLQAAYTRLAGTDADEHEEDAVLHAIAERLDRLSHTLEELKSHRR